VEVKAESELRAGQLEGYRVILQESGVVHQQLVLLTRYPEVFPAHSARPDLEIRWFELADWLESELVAADATDPIAGFLVRQLLDFLGARSMALAQVGKYMPEGVRALSNLMNMLLEAGAACKVQVSKRVEWKDFGVNLDGPKCWIGVNFSEPEKLWFATRCRIDPEAAAKLGVGEVTQQRAGHYRWWRGVELDSESCHFFSRSKVGQMQWLEDFMRECLAQARAIATPDQPPISDEPEEGN
jgi:hypothetical protein